MTLSADVRRRMTSSLRSQAASSAICDAIDGADYVGTVGTTSGLSVVERGNGAIHKSVITLNNVSIAINDDAASSSDGGAWGSLKLYDFPEGHVAVYGAHMVFPAGSVTAGSGGIVDAATLKMGVGTTAREYGASFALASAEKNIVPENAAVGLTGGTTTAIESSAFTTTLISDGSSTASDAYLNVVAASDSDASAEDTLTVSGTVTIIWMNMGDD